MRRNHLLNCMMITALSTIAQISLAADTDPIGKKIDNAQIMERVALIGVIAGGSDASGVAVIKDTKTGRTYAIKTGDNLPGVGHIKLSSVRRELAVFNVDGQDYSVRLSVGGYAQTADDDEDLEADLNEEHEGPGLFEKWHGSGIADLDIGQDDEANGIAEKMVNTRRDESEVKTKRSAKGNTPTDKNPNHTEIVVETNDQARAEEANALRTDKDGPVHEFLDELTTAKSQDSKLKNKINAANATKKQIKAENVNVDVRNEAAE